MCQFSVIFDIVAQGSACWRYFTFYSARLLEINVHTENQMHSLVVNANTVKSSNQCCNVYNRSVCVYANKLDRLRNLLIKCSGSSKNQILVDTAYRVQLFSSKGSNAY